MGYYALMLKEAEQFVLSCHNFDCENSTSGAWVAAWKNKIRMKILDPPGCAHINQQLLHIFKKSCKEATDWVRLIPTHLHLVPLTIVLNEAPPTIVNENSLMAQKWLSAKVTAMYMHKSQSVSYRNMLAACT